jgi:hypothetical protein
VVGSCKGGQPFASAATIYGDSGATGAGLHVGGGDVLLPDAHLQLEVVEAALHDGIGAIVEGRQGWHVAAAVDLDAICGPQLLR